MSIPPILLEGDEPAGGLLSGPGQKYVVSPQPVLGETGVVADVPELGGGSGLSLIPRDSRCLYAHWELPPEQQQACNRLSKDRHPVLRVWQAESPANSLPEIHVHPESRSWFVHVPQGGTAYQAELGFYGQNEAWNRLALSAPATTPVEQPSEERPVEFATVVPKAACAGEAVRLERPAEAVPKPVSAPTPSAASSSPLPAAFRHNGGRQVEQAQPPPTAVAIPAGKKPAAARAELAARAPAPATPHAEFSQPQPGPQPIEAAFPWHAEQEQALAAIVTECSIRRESIGSLEIERLIQGEARRLAEAGMPAAEAEAQAAAQVEAMLAQAAAEPISSPAAAAPSAGESSRSWFSINAELVVYGAAGPEAEVMIGDRRIRLRPDGSFSYRFALPDGVYELPIAATGSGGETRRVRLTFSRSTVAEGEVRAHLQDPSLKTPAPENVE